MNPKTSPILDKRTKKQERAVAFVVVRLSSSRFPGKQFQRIGPKSLLDWVIKGLKSAVELDEIVIATVAEPDNLPLKEFAERRHIPLFWYEGEVDHVTTRLRKAAEAYDADICLLISGDCPLIHGPAIDHLVSEFCKNPAADILRIRSNDPDGSPALQGVSIARKRAWQLADDLSDRPELKEHQFPIMNLLPDRFNAISVLLPPDCYGPRCRLSVDTWADLAFMNMVHDQLLAIGKPFQLPEVLSLLKDRPELTQMNHHVHQRRLIEDIRKVVMVVDVGPPYGYGHFTRSLELGLQMVEKASWPVTFVVDHIGAVDQALRRGFRVLWGAFGRPAHTPPADDAPPALTQEHLFHHDLMIVDIFDQRGPKPGWRREFPPSLAVAAIDHLGDWAWEADSVICPSVTRPETPTTGNRMPPGSGETVYLSGKPYLILRRELLQAAQLPRRPKDIDMLAYIHDPQDRDALAACCKRSAVSVQIIEGFRNDFFQLLLRSRLFLSGFGVSFYEALFLGVMPICLPCSPQHQAAAEQFYQAFGLIPRIFNKVLDMERHLPDLLLEHAIPRGLMEDGTGRIVTELVGLVRSRTPFKAVP